MSRKPRYHHLSTKIIPFAVRLVILIATFVAIYVFFVSVAAQLTSIRISETLVDMGSGRVTASPTTEFKEKKIDITRQVGGVLPITLSLSPVSDYTVIAGGVTNNGTVTLPADQNTLSVLIRFHPSSEGIKTATLTITQGASAAVKLTGRGVKTGTSPLCPSAYFPESGKRDIATAITLRWAAGSDPDGGTVSYKVYVDDDKDITTHSDGVGIANMVQSGGAISFVSPSYTTALSGLNSNTTYYWVVEVTDDEGSQVQCPRGSLLSFVTQSAVSSATGIRYEYPTEVIQFDPRIILNPPPGFNDERFRLPQTNEVIAN